MANNEGALRKAAKDGDLATVRKLVGEGTAQQPDEVRILNWFLFVTSGNFPATLVYSFKV